MTQTTTEAAEDAAGYTAGLKAIETLTEILDPTALYHASVASIIRVEHAALASTYDRGASQAWADWQAKRRVNKRHNWRG